MRGRLWATVGGWWVVAGAALAQPAPDPPDHLPPLLPVPDRAAECHQPAPRPKCLAGCEVEYDRSLLYLPDRKPESPSASPPSTDAERCWAAPAVLLGWTEPSRRVAPPMRAGLAFDGGVWLDGEAGRGIDAGVVYLPQAVGRLGPDELRTRFVTVEVGYRRRLVQRDGLRLDGLLGYRFAHVGEDAASGPRPADARTAFHGGEVGLSAAGRWERWAVDLTGKVGLGASIMDAEPAGDSTRFAVAPAVSARVGRELSGHALLFAGYTFNYLSRAARAADQPGTSDFWAQGVTLGVEWRY
jgi:hypothetical protein